MKKIALLLLYFFMISCYQQERNCTDFKTGRFEFKQSIDGKEHTTTFIRTENMQIETYEGKTDTAMVRWVNDCEFILEKLHPKNMQEKKVITMKILYTKDNTYTFEYAFVGEQKKMRGLVTKLN
ncbi:DNA topoisomerase IV [Flavobacterium capsici]|uniref:DNA topoisomerase IV n=1 Tax=Flavobacterium capsici TaxID=3075618 RepID=A0AA96J4K9_9FLAO|nr:MULTISPECIES: DNA topoisomerase IV [unclassified Flavobacterium]WNM18121.1 DNA topoisomerase IV [Flavobacterium sp. PMR2A8]WNM22173.1 DNA topoisomerase IV [Flavobacterium sp. PMTSA4]